MRSMKRLLCLALATGTLITAMPIQSMASSDYKYITNISLKVDIDLDSGDEINDGDSLGTDSSDSGNKVYTSSNKYRVQSAEWSNDKEVTIGDTPKITVSRRVPATAIMITVSAAATVQAASVSAAELLCLLPKAEATLRW